MQEMVQSAFATMEADPEQERESELQVLAPEPARVRVFILDDHELVRRGMRDLLTETGGFELVGESGSAQEAIRRIPALRPDVALLDVRLPDGSGLDVCREVRALDPTIKVLMITSFDDEDAMVAAGLAGAAGFVLKQVRGTDLARAVRRVAAGEMLLDRRQAEAIARRLHGSRYVDPRLAVLTGQEQRILDLIVEGLTNRQIGERLHIAEKTVKNHVTNVLVKLGFERRTQAAVFGARLRDHEHDHEHRHEHDHEHACCC
jgi:two-component system, NarL family, response regulator DevR